MTKRQQAKLNEKLATIRDNGGNHWLSIRIVAFLNDPNEWHHELILATAKEFGAILAPAEVEHIIWGS